MWRSGWRKGGVERGPRDRLAVGLVEREGEAREAHAQTSAATTVTGDRRDSTPFPSAYFDVTVNTTTGSFRSNYRLWYYETRATGTRIDEYYLRMDHETIDQTTPGGGDLLVISKLPPRSPTPYEVTILPRGHPNYAASMTRCTRLAALDKVWEPA